MSSFPSSKILSPLLALCMLLCITACSSFYNESEWEYYAEIKRDYIISESLDTHLTNNKGEIGRGSVNEYLLETGNGDFKNCYLKRSLWGHNDRTMADVYGNKNGNIIVCHFALKQNRYILTHYHLFTPKS